MLHSPLLLSHALLHGGAGVVGAALGCALEDLELALWGSACGAPAANYSKQCKQEKTLGIYVEVVSRHVFVGEMSVCMNAQAADVFYYVVIDGIVRSLILKTIINNCLSWSECYRRQHACVHFKHASMHLPHRVSSEMG